MTIYIRIQQDIFNNLNIFLIIINTIIYDVKTTYENFLF